MLIRKYSTWIPHAPPLVHSSTASSSRTAGGAGAGPSTPRVVPGVPTSTPGLSSSLSEEMQRIAADRQRKKDHIQWARIHAAALELGVLGLGRVGDTDNSGYTYAMGRAFSEMMARDAVWESDEVEWVAGICVLRSVIRTAMRGDRRQRDEYDELLRTYEGRWKEIKDEARQALVTVSLFWRFRTHPNLNCPLGCFTWCKRRFIPHVGRELIVSCYFVCFFFVVATAFPLLCVCVCDATTILLYIYLLLILIRSISRLF